MYSTVVWGIYLTEREDCKHRVGGDCRYRLLGCVQTIVADCTEMGVWTFPNGFGESTHQGCADCNHWCVQILAADRCGLQLLVVAECTHRGCGLYPPVNFSTRGLYTEGVGEYSHCAGGDGIYCQFGSCKNG
jgi:hypothetical protein